MFNVSSNLKTTLKIRAPSILRMVDIEKPLPGSDHDILNDLQVQSHNSSLFKKTA